MNRTMVAEPTQDDAASMQAEIDRYIAEIKTVREQMRPVQAEILASRAQSRQTMTEIAVMLARLQAS